MKENLFSAGTGLYVCASPTSTIRGGVRLMIEHQAGVLMGDTDNLSRGKKHSLDAPKEFILSATQTQKLDALFQLLNPSVVCRF